MSFVTVGAIIAVGGGIAKAIDGGIRMKKAKAEAAEAKLEYEQNKDMFRSLDTSNPYLNMENVYEDLTVNQEQAQFQSEQFKQQQSNVLDSLRQTTGESGAAGLAAEVLRQGNIASKETSMSIGQQERQNQIAMMGESSRLQDMEREGEVYSRELEAGKVTGLLGMSQNEMATAKAEQAAARGDMWAGINTVAGTMMGGGLSGLGGGGARRGGGGSVGEQRDLVTGGWKPDVQDESFRRWQRGDQYQGSGGSGYLGLTRMGPNDNFTGPGGYQYRNTNQSNYGGNQYWQNDWF